MRDGIAAERSKFLAKPLKPDSDLELDPISEMIQSSAMTNFPVALHRFALRGCQPVGIAILLAAIASRGAVAADHTPPPVQPATDFSAVEVHADERLAIAAEPYDTHDKTAIFRVDYLSHGVMPVRLIVTNNGDRSISLKEARILFVTSQGDRIQAADPEDVERLMTRKEREGGKIPLPGPLPSIHLKPKASNKEVEQDFDTFEFQAW
jgi:hypothetical protein